MPNGPLETISTLVMGAVAIWFLWRAWWRAGDHD